MLRRCYNILDPRRAWQCYARWLMAHSVDVIANPTRLVSMIDLMTSLDKESDFIG